MIVVSGIVMIRPGDAVQLPVFCMKGPVIGLGSHCAGTVLGGLKGGGDGQRQDKTQGRPKHPDPQPSLTSCLHHCPWGFAPFRVLPHPPRGDSIDICQIITPTQATPLSPPG